MPDALRIGLLGPLQVRDEAGRAVHVGGRRLRLLLILLALDAGRGVPSASLAERTGPMTRLGIPVMPCRPWFRGCGPNCAASTSSRLPPRWLSASFIRCQLTRPAPTATMPTAGRQASCGVVSLAGVSCRT
jgi:hypothetical protein